MVTPTQNVVWALALAVGALLTARSEPVEPGPSPAAEVVSLAPVAAQSFSDELFRTGDRCIACHKGVATSDGTDVSIGYDWRASMMANAARDPYWQAAVRREITDHPDASAAIEAKCSRCHMPMANVVARAGGADGSVFANLPVGGSDAEDAALAADGVSCSVCHQIASDGLGLESSFTGEFVIDGAVPAEGRPMFGPFEPDQGGVGIMHSATGFRPTEAPHVQTSELCASCPTLFTHAIRPGGAEGPEFPEQVPYLEWQASSFADEGTSCQDCHMPEVAEDVPVTRVLGRARAEVSRHVFRGGNFFMLRMLGRYRGELGVVALPQELSLAADRTEEHLRSETATVSITDAAIVDGRMEVDVRVENTAGHKFPTAYPSRRAWLHVIATDGNGRVVFESGAFAPDGRIVGNDNDDDPSSFERHHDRITAADQVQIYEAVMVDAAGDVTTGLMSAERWIKENRLLPRGFDAGTADGRTAVIGGAVTDANFAAAFDRVTYSVEVGSAATPLTVRAELLFQPIGYRWAENLADYDTFETSRFVRYYREMAHGSAIVIAFDEREAG